MISMKAGTVPIVKSDPVQGHTEAEFKAAFGDQNLGEVLNKLSDANWVDPAKTRDVGKNQLDKDAFFKLMLTQMQNQDPANPLKSHEMAAQMAQFTSLEQLSNINSTLEKMSQTQNAGSPFESLQFIGKHVRGDSAKFTRGSGDKTHEVGFTLPQDATKIKIEIKDTEGKIVKTLNLNNLKTGKHNIKWNGVTEEGMAARPGDYRFDIVAEQSGKKMLVDTQFEGPISGVKFVSGQPILMVGEKAVSLSDVQQISVPRPERAQKIMPFGAALQEDGAQDSTPHDQLQVAQGRESDVPEQSILDSIPMTSAFRNRLEKETNTEEFSAPVKEQK